MFFEYNIYIAMYIEQMRTTRQVKFEERERVVHCDTFITQWSGPLIALYKTVL